MAREGDSEQRDELPTDESLFATQYYDTSLDWVPTAALRGAAHSWYPVWSRMLFTMESVGEYFVRLLGLDESRYDYLEEQRDTLRRRRAEDRMRSAHGSVASERDPHDPNAMQEPTNFSILVGENPCDEEVSTPMWQSGQPRPFPIDKLPEMQCKQMKI